MSQINPKHLIDELKDNVLKEDRIKALLVLEHFFDVDTGTQKELLSILEQGAPEFSIPLLLGLIRKDPHLPEKLPEIKRVLSSKFVEAPTLLMDYLVKLLTDTTIHPPKLFIEIAGEIRLKEALPILINLLSKNQQPETLKSIITALRQIANPMSVNAISEFLYSNDKALTIAAIKALGNIANQTAIQRLAEKLGHDPRIDILILDIFSQIQDNLCLQKLNETLASQHAHLRNYAKTKLIQLGPKAVPILTQNLLRSDDPDMVIHTLNVLGEIGDEAAVGPIRKLLDTQPKNPNIRFTAYEALGMLPLNKSAYTLAAGLTDPEEHVRIAALAAIDRNLNNLLVAGLRNMIRQKDAEAINIIRSIINAQAKNIFLQLIEVPEFQDFALKFLSKNTPPDIRNFFQKLLEEHGYKELAEKLTSEQATEQPKIKAVAVDDSKMILNIYKSTLFELGCEPILFIKPLEAVEWLKNNKPDIVFTDLNMPGITGVELIERTRDIYPKEELPIIMVTTQNEMQDNEAAIKAGVNEIMFKPFSSDSLKQMLEKYVKRS
jgi:CheY-like chemotaxis protein/HEAT repeat protein